MTLEHIAKISAIYMMTVVVFAIGHLAYQQF